MSQGKANVFGTGGRPRASIEVLESPHRLHRDAFRGRHVLWVNPACVFQLTQSPNFDVYFSQTKGALETGRRDRITKINQCCMGILIWSRSVLETDVQWP
jgi:hypothetical protein